MASAPFTAILGIVGCWFFFGFANPVSAASSAEQNAAAAHAVSNSNFAIADFDGDREPDVASVEYGRLDSSEVRYAVNLHLSGGGGQSIGVSAPFGGLSIEARDVNGDAALDLVVSSRWLRRPVAILINDGHGQFTLTSPAAYPGIVGGYPTGWTSRTESDGENVALAPARTSSGELDEARYLPPNELPDRLYLTRQTTSVSRVVLPSGGRAPPAFPAVG